MMSLDSIEKKLDKILNSVEKTHESNTKAIGELYDKVNRHEVEISAIKENYIKKINNDGKVGEVKLSFYAVFFLFIMLLLAYFYGGG